MKKGVGFITVLAIVGLLGYWVYTKYNTPNEGSLKAVSNFSIKDTASINKLVISNTDGDTTTLQRSGDGFWKANEKYRIQEAPMNTMLKTIRNIRVKSEVNDQISDNMIDQMVINNSKVDIYQDGRLSKTYWVGNPTKNKYGTYMLLETTEEGRSSKVFVMELPGHKGHLASRFFADVEKWRFSGIYNYKMDNLAQVKIKNYEKPEESLEINLEGTNTFKLNQYSGESVGAFDTARVANYLPQYKKIHYNFFENNLTKKEKDSLKQSQPMYKISVTDKEGKTKSVTCYKRQAYKGAKDVKGDQLEYDPDRFTAILSNGNFVVCQYFVFDPLFKTLSYFKGEKESGVQTQNQTSKAKSIAGQ